MSAPAWVLKGVGGVWYAGRHPRDAGAVALTHESGYARRFNDAIAAEEEYRRILAAQAGRPVRRRTQLFVRPA